MRVGFRTTLEKELITQLKEEAARMKKNVNDILEILIYDFLEEVRESDEKVAELEALPEDKDLLEFLVDRIMEQLDKCVYSYRFDYRGIPRAIIRDVIYSVFLNFFAKEFDQEY